VFSDPRLVAAIVDRVAFNAHIIENRHSVARIAQRAQAVMGRQVESVAPP
jgi:hypothetical protein